MVPGRAGCDGEPPTRRAVIDVGSGDPNVGPGTFDIILPGITFDDLHSVLIVISNDASQVIDAAGVQFVPQVVDHRQLSVPASCSTHGCQVGLARALLFGLDRGIVGLASGRGKPFSLAG